MGQRRFVTVMFSDMSGSTELAERLEVEEMSTLLDRFRVMADEIVPRHGGVIASFQGDGFMALFGHDRSHENDARRAAEAALDLHAAVEGLTVRRGNGWQPVQLHTGIHGGLVLLVDGDAKRGQLGVVGEVVHTASRLCSSAAAGEILVSTDSLGPHAHFFQLARQRRIAIRGRTAGIETVQVQRRTGVGRRIDAAAQRGVVPFVGREALLAELEDMAQRALDGPPIALLLSGEAGIGKTRLVDEFSRRIPRERFQVMRGYCERYLGAEPLQPFLQAVRDALGWQAGLDAAQVEALARDRLAALPAERREALLPLAWQLLGLRPAVEGAAPAGIRLPMLIDLLLALSDGRVLVVVLDDWQWADDASRAALEVLRSRRHAMFLLLAARPFSDDDHALLGAELRRLLPLEAGEARRAITGWLPDADPFLIQEIVAQAGGSPLFIEELCQVTVAGAAPLQAQTRPSGVAWINALVASRFERLSPAQANCLRCAAVVGAVLPERLLAALCGETLAQALADVVAAGDFIVPAEQSGMLRFRHALTRDAVYAMVDPVLRQDLHRQVAQALEAGLGQAMGAEPLDALAYHFDAARLDTRAAHYAEAAGDRALASMALDRARALYTTALSALDRMPALAASDKARWCAIAQRLGQTCVFDPLDVAHSFTLFERAVQLARETGDANVLARAAYWLAYVNYGKGRPREAARHGEHALALAQASGDAKLQAQVQATLAQALASAGRYELAMPLFEQAVQSKREHSHPGSSTAIGSAYTFARMGYTMGDLGRFDDAHAFFAEAMQLLGDKVHSVKASVQELVCAVHLWQGRWAEAEAIGLTGAEMALRCRSRYLTSMGNALAACGGWAARHDAVSFQRLHDSTLWIEARGGAVSTSLNYGWLVEAALALGRMDAMRRHALQLFARARLHDRHGLGQGCRALARQALKRDDAPRARRHLAQAEAAATLRHSPREQALNTLARADLARWQQQPADALALAGRAAEAFERMGMAWHLDQARGFMASETGPT